jgi:hypothetical protein
VSTQERVPGVSGLTVELSTVPQLVITVPGAASSLTLSVIETAFVPPTPRVPVSQVTVPPATWHAPDTEMTEAADVSIGSVTTTSAAGSGPSLVTVSV